MESAWQILGILLDTKSDDSSLKGDSLRVNLYTGTAPSASEPPTSSVEAFNASRRLHIGAESTLLAEAKYSKY